MRKLLLIFLLLCSVGYAQTHVTYTECAALVNGTGGSGDGGRMNNTDFLNCITSAAGWSDNVNAQTGTTYTVVEEDAGRLTTFSNGSAVAVTLPQAGTTGFEDGSWFVERNKGAGTVTITPTTSTINGGSTYTLATNAWVIFWSDGTNYQTIGSSSAGISNIVEDTTPQLGGNLDLNGNVITGLEIGTNVQAYDADLTTYAGITPSANMQAYLASADYAAMRTNLGLVIGTNVQAYDADLTTYAGITPSANIQTFLGAADYAAMRTQLGLVIGTNVQAYDADLTTWAGITPGTGIGTFLTTPSSANLIAAVTDETGTGALVFGTSPTIVTPTIASFANAAHDHSNAAGGGTLGTGAVDTITDIAAGLKSGSDVTLITGTEGTSGNCAQWNADGDLVDSGGTCGAGSGALGDLTNVTEASVANDEVLQYVTDHWENQTLAEAGIQAALSLAAGVETFLGTPSSANLISAVTDETGTGSLVFSASPVFTGTVDMGGAQLEAPNGDPTTDGVGEIGVDTTTDQFQFYGAAERALPSIMYTGTAFADPADTDDANFLKAPYAMTVVGIDCIVQGTTSVTGQVQECATDGTSCTDLDSDITCDADGAADDGSLTDSAIASGAWLRWKTTSVSGTPTFLTVTMKYRVVPD